ncbi:MAG TPA: hypothetical protein VGP31_06000 [Planosporangium sp.]|nr:hypothetical protein [Planosporangium sp.]
MATAPDGPWTRILDLIEALYPTRSRAPALLAVVFGSLLGALVAVGASVAVAPGSARQGPAVVEVSCADGSGGRLVLDPDVDGPVTMPEQLAFLDPGDCVITQPATGAARTSTVRVSAMREPSTGGGAAGSAVAIGRDP